jgi:virginiamycin B lyase
VKSDGAEEALSGTVVDENGAPAPGVFVTAHRQESSVSVSTTTDAQGRYALSGLDPGAYEVQAHQVGFDDSEPEAYQHEARGEIDLVVARTEDVFGQLPSARYLNLLPDGETKRRFILDCTGCHQFNRVRGTAGQVQHDMAYWEQWTNTMISFAGGNSGFPVISPSRDATETAAWLTMNLGTPGAPAPTLAPFQPTPAETGRATITEYTLPAPNDLPHDLMPDADGNIVITGMMTARMYRLNPETGEFATFLGSNQFAGPRALTIDEDGKWWVLLGGPQQIAGYDPEQDQLEVHDIGMYPHSIVRDEQGQIWFNGHFTKNPELIGKLNPETGEVQTYRVPVGPMPDGGTTMPYGMRIDAEGTLWATQLIGNRLIKFVPETEQFSLYDLPTSFGGARRPDIGPDGIVWVPEYAAGKLARFDPATETFREYDLPIKDALPYIVRVDPRTGVVWVATAAADAVLRFLPDEERFIVYDLPTRSALIRHMELDPKTGAAWVAYGNSPSVQPKIARIDVMP